MALYAMQEQKADRVIAEYRLNPQTDSLRYFIVGTQKSGTTWLRDCLDVFVPFCKPEWYFPELVENIRRSVDTYGRALSKSERDLRVRTAARAALQEICGPCVGEKSAYPCAREFGQVRSDLHPFAVRLLREHFPGCRIAVIIRDPRAVYNSLRHYVAHSQPECLRWLRRINADRFAREWSRQNLAWVADRPDAVVFYEKLKQDFSGTLNDVLNKMEIEHTMNDVEQARELVYSVDRLRPRQPEIYRTGTVDEWRTKVPAKIAAKIAMVAEPAMTELGYTCE